MTREEIQEVLANPMTGYVWLGYSTFSDKKHPVFQCVRVDAFNRATGVLTYETRIDLDRNELELDKIIFAKAMDHDVWSALMSWRHENLTGFTLKGTMMSQCGEITIKGRITRVEQTLGTVHFESDFMLSDIAELIPHFRDDDTDDPA